MAKKKPIINQRTYRTREHILEDLSVNFVERKVLESGHELEKPNKKDYGTDAVMHHYDPANGALENGRVEIQLKATDQLDSKLTHGGTIISVNVQIANLNYWVWGTVHPFILIIYDGVRNEAFWLDVKQFYGQTNIDLEGDSVTLLKL
jgi:hypothetical protein